MRIVLPSLHQAQLEIANDRTRFKVIAAGRRFGKGILETAKCMAWAARGRRTWWISPSFASASFKAGWRMMNRIADATEGKIEKHIQGKEFLLPGGGSVTIRSAEEPDSLRGEGLDGVVIDEAAHVPKLQEIWEQCLRPALMDRKGWADFISTPRGFNFFEQLYQRGIRRENGEWKSFQYPTSSNPSISPVEIEAMGRDMPNLVRRQEVCAEFVQLAGALFKREWFTVLPKCEGAYQWVRAWDLAVTTKASSDYTVGAKCCLLPDGSLVIGHIVRGRWEWPEASKIIKQTAQSDGPGVPQIVESVGTQAGLVQALRADPGLADVAVRARTVTVDKLSRALPVIGKAESQRIAIVQGEWNTALVDEFCAWSGSDDTHDDQIDAVTLANTELGGGLRGDYGMILIQ